MILPQTTVENKPPAQTYTRCPGCFDWTPEDTAAFFAPGMLDDKKAYLLCQHCATVLDNSDIAKYDVVQRIFKNIGVYAGWSSK